jgi:carbonic anhydrase/acetyltransferase-like protein (isoleucine patch superfamily)
MTPFIDPTAWIADNATIRGDVTIGPDSGIWFTSVLRAGAEPIAIGARTNIQDGCVLHTDPGFPIIIGDGVSVGHRAVLHGCRIGDDSLIGMGAIVMNGAVIGQGCLVAAGALIPEGMKVPNGSLVVGAPAKVRRPATDTEANIITSNAVTYVAERPLKS